MKLKPLIAITCLIALLGTGFASEYCYIPVIVTSGLPITTNIVSVVIPSTTTTGSTVEIAIQVKDSLGNNMTSGVVQINYTTPLTTQTVNATYSSGAFRANITANALGLWNFIFNYMSNNVTHADSSPSTSSMSVTGWASMYEIGDIVKETIDFIGGTLSSFSDAAQSLVWIIVAGILIGISIELIAKVKEYGQG